MLCCTRKSKKWWKLIDFGIIKEARLMPSQIKGAEHFKICWREKNKRWQLVPIDCCHALWYRRSTGNSPIPTRQEKKIDDTLVHLHWDKDKSLTWAIASKSCELLHLIQSDPAQRHSRPEQPICGMFAIHLLLSIPVLVCCCFWTNLRENSQQKEQMQMFPQFLITTSQPNGYKFVGPTITNLRETRLSNKLKRP